MGGVILVLLLVLGVPVAIIVWLGRKASRAACDIDRLESRLRSLELDMRSLRRELHTHEPAAEPTPPPIPKVVVSLPKIESKPVTPVPWPPAPPPKIPQPVPVHVAQHPTETLPAPPVKTWVSTINWEQFMGVRLFAWIGGFALFLGLVFFLKYAFEKKLISPEMQVAIEYFVGLGLLGGGLCWRKKQFAVISQTLCATGVLELYAVTFAAHSYYQLLGIAPCFAVMVLVTVVAFLLAVRLEAQVVAILGLLGGFLTPILLSTGKDNPLGLFSYIALLDAGLIAVVSRKRWNYLVLLGAIGTVLMEIAWVVKFFEVGKATTAMGIFLGMEALFLLGFVLAQKRKETDTCITSSAFLLAVAPLMFTLHLLKFPSLGGSPAIIFTFVLVADLGLLTLATLRQPLYPIHLVAGAAVFLILSIWQFQYLTTALLNWALGFYLLFAILHAVFPIVLQRLRPGTAPVWWGHLFPLFTLLLVMIPILRWPELSLAIWLYVLLLDLVVFGLALLTASVFAIIGALVLTVVATAMWIFKVPAVVTGLPELLTVIGGFALLFFMFGIFASRRFARKPARADMASPLPFGVPQISVDVRAQIPALSAILPFVLLIMVVLRLPLADPSPVFGLAMLLVVLLLGVARATTVDWLAAVGLACSVALEYAWHSKQQFNPGTAVVPLVWYLAFVAVFTLFPFVFRKAMEGRIIPWAAAALAGPVHFTLVYQLVKAAWPNQMMGLLPATFAVPPLLGLIFLIREIPKTSATRNAVLAWFGGATLFFVTLIFPIQFDRQWITIGWALEGVALLWLFYRVPHPGLRLVGVALLVVAFARLALNPAVLTYHPRSGTVILNWFLYAYGIVSVCLFTGAKLLGKDQKVLGSNAPVLLVTLGTVLAFLLLNIEIADYFTATGTQALTFQFSGNFASDMTYSIAWALFALTLLLAGIIKRLPPARYASLALLSVTLLKLFFHDLTRLSQLYRICAFVGVAIVLLVSSFLYQRFVTTDNKAK